MAFDTRDFFVRFANAVNARDRAALSGLIHREFVAEIRQSGERSLGLEQFLAQLEGYPEGSPYVPLDADIVGTEGRWAISPGYTVVALSSPNEFTIVTKARYPDGTLWHIVAVVELRDEKLFRMENYFAPEMRAPLVESMASYGRG